jgi:CBS-domain-containing membrane protein
MTVFHRELDRFMRSNEWAKRERESLEAPHACAQAMRTAIGGGLGLSLMVAFASWARLLLEAVPFTTSIVLVMAAPESGQTQPRNIIGGHLLSALSGLLVRMVFGTNPFLAGLAVALSIAAMQLTGTLHPPAAGINAVLFVSLKRSWPFVPVPVAVGALGLVAFAFLYHRLAAPGRRSQFWWIRFGNDAHARYCFDLPLRGTPLTRELS